MEINLLSGALGAEIKGINLKDTSKENWEKIKPNSSQDKERNFTVYQLIKI